jgi:hypothetical protein
MCRNTSAAMMNGSRKWKAKKRFSVTSEMT